MPVLHCVMLEDQKNIFYHHMKPLLLYFDED
eukprot:UN03826